MCDFKHNPMTLFITCRWQPQGVSVRIVLERSGSDERLPNVGKPVCQRVTAELAESEHCSGQSDYPTRWTFTCRVMGLTSRD
jgi:hypothetical protein